MLIGLISDTHGDIGKVKEAARMFQEQGIQAVIHCGDSTRISHLEPLINLDLPVHVVEGNMDRNPAAFRDRSSSNHFHYHGMVGQIELGGRKLGFTHGHSDSYLRKLRKNNVDYIIHGHTHERRDERTGNTRFINPGAAKSPAGSAAVLDLKSDELTFLTL